jgi:hypothetical protein
MNLYEVQWTKPVQVESHGELYLVGCRLTFGPSHYWSFSPSVLPPRRRCPPPPRHSSPAPAAA